MIVTAFLVIHMIHLHSVTLIENDKSKKLCLCLWKIMLEEKEQDEKLLICINPIANQELVHKVKIVT